MDEGDTSVELVPASPNKNVDEENTSVEVVPASPKNFRRSEGGRKYGNLGGLRRLSFRH